MLVSTLTEATIRSRIVIAGGDEYDVNMNPERKPWQSTLFNPLHLTCALA